MLNVGTEYRKGILFVRLKGHLNKDTIKKLDLQDHIVTSNDVQEVFRKYYKIDIAKKENVKFGEELDKKYYIEEE